MRRLGSAGRYVESFLLSRRMAGALRSLQSSGQIQAAEFAEASLDAYHSIGRIQVPHFLKCHAPLTLLEEFAPTGYGAAALAMERQIVKRAPLVLSPSDDLRRRLGSVFGLEGRVVHVVPNPVEHHVYTPQARAVAASDHMVLFVGRLEKQKGAAVLAEAIPHILKRVPRATFICAGENRLSDLENNEFRKLAKIAGAGTAPFRFTGQLNEPELVKLFAKASVCVVPSPFYESFSYTAAEAMSCGRAVVASRVGGIPEVVEDGVTGLLVEPGNAEELADAVCRLLKDPETATKMGEAGRRRVLDLYDPARVAAQNLELLGLAKAGGTRTLSGAAPLTTPGERL